MSRVSLARAMKLSDFLRDDATGRGSHSKLWANLGSAAMTTGFIKVVWTATATEGLAWLFLVYGGVVCGSQVASKLLGRKLGAGTPPGGRGAAPPK